MRMQYDGATWEIALALLGLLELPEVYERGVLYLASTAGGSDLTAQPPAQTNGLQNLRADTVEFLYGPSQTPGSALPLVEFPCGSWNATLCEQLEPVMKPGASFFRLISSNYIAEDVYAGQFNFDWRVPTYDAPAWNVWGTIVWNDWKPITGENVWAAIIGPLQYLIIRNQTLGAQDNSTAASLEWEEWGDVPPQIKLALTVLPALKALQSVEGALYHCPQGSQIFPADPDEATNVSNENNFSAYAALRMLAWAIKEFMVQDIPQLVDALNTLRELQSGLERWFRTYALGELEDGTKVFYQGGHVPFGGGFEPVDLEADAQGFAVDCQTWGSLVLTPQVVDQIGGEDGTALRLWNATKTRAGYFNPDGSLGGVGFAAATNSTNATAAEDTDKEVWSTEWTYGAIFAVRAMAEHYNATHPEWVLPLLRDIESMERSLVRYVEEGGMQLPEGGFLYANQRYFIPWGWFANPVGSLCGTSWHVFNRFHFNPFVPGGGLVDIPNWPPTVDDY